MKLERRPIKAEVSTRVELLWEPDDADVIRVQQVSPRKSQAAPLEFVVGAVYLEYRWVATDVEGALGGSWSGSIMARGWRVMRGGLSPVTTMLHQRLFPGGEWPSDLEALLELHHPAYAIRLGASLPVEVAELAEAWPLAPGMGLMIEFPPIVVGP